MSDIDRIRERLAKLLRLSEDSAASEGEIENAVKMATQLMARHQLTRDDIDLSAIDPMEKLRMGRHFAFTKGSRILTWEICLSYFVTEFIGTVQFYRSEDIPLRRGGITLLDEDGNPRTGTAVAFYGPDEDSECAVMMFEEIRDAIVCMAIVRWGGFSRDDGAAYAEGFAEALRSCHVKAIAELKASDNETLALMIQTAETSLAITNKATDWLKDTHKIKLKTSRGRKWSRGSADARLEGAKDGANYNPTRPEVRRKLG